MKSRVFLSCGQRPGEAAIATQLGTFLRARGFDVYVAIDAQTILEINSGIIRELKNSDCFLFVNFCRESIGSSGCRGSLFSNQELAIAHAMGFERILVINQNGIAEEGMLRYIGVNTERFNDFEDCHGVVERAIDRAAWAADYSRRLQAANLVLRNEPIIYRGPAGVLCGRFLYVDICNGRPDIAALEATARLSAYGPSGGAMVPSAIRSPLKASARPGFSHIIFPKSHEAFDLLCVGAFVTPANSTGAVPAASGAMVPSYVVISERGLYLNSALDVAGAGRLPLELGVWELRYEFYAIDFPVLAISVEVDATSWDEPKVSLISDEVT